jgi:hypothetical protein
MRAEVRCRQLYCLLFGLMVSLCGCASGTSRKTSSIKSIKGVEASAAELSSQNQSLLGRYSAEIETAADQIIFESPSAPTRRQALVWKAEAIPVLQRSLLNTDPLAAALDTWAFIMQMTACMDRPVAKQGWGEFYPVVVEALKRMDTEMEQLMKAAAPSANIAAARWKVGAWAQAHPIEAGLAGRNSADADLIRGTKQSDLGTVASVKALAESIGDVTARLDSYNAYLPKQARWQAELLLSDLGRDPQVGAAMSNVAALSHTLEKASGSMESLPVVARQLHEAVLEDVDGQRLAAQAFLRQERLETLEGLKQERIATVAELHSERLAATADLQKERQIVLEALHAEGVAGVRDLNTAREKALEDFDAKARGLIDHFYLRALELVLLTMVLCFLAAWILLRQFTGRRRDHGERLYDRAA